VILFCVVGGMWICMCDLVLCCGCMWICICLQIRLTSFCLLQNEVFGYGVLSTLMMPVIIAVVGKEEEKFPNV
jgi:hypothetical protein